MMLRVREARILCGISVYQAAAQANVSPQMLKMVELGTQAPYPRIRRQLSKLYRVPQYVLFEDWDRTIEYMQKIGGGLRKALPEYKGVKGLDGEIHRRVQPNDD
jgi:transcriptional regulator with XRE-family HTH domain